VIPYNFTLTKQAMTQQSCLSFFVFFKELSPEAYPAHQTINAAKSGIARIIISIVFSSTGVELFIP